MYQGYGGFRIKPGVFSKFRVDVFVVYESEDGFVHYAWPYLDVMYNNTIFPVSIVYPTGFAMIRGAVVRGPKDPESVLRHQYNQFTLKPLHGWKEWRRAWWEMQVWTRIIGFVNLFSPDMGQYYQL